ncbi:hypothetical protein Cni_G07747 [Canna indica]|uniref:Uncharacterized protein n=1 Tax=Canna indica TaxID=4628 RepID=A0AAQ3K4K6_9LILI|nr:hypothetical protein Cni_G07747 [Canna indica]
MISAQALPGVDEVKPDVAVQSENRDSVDTEDTPGIFCANNGDATLCVGSSSNPMKVEVIPNEGKLYNILKSENRETVDSDNMSELFCRNNLEDSVFCAGSSTGLKKVSDIMDVEVDIINCTDSIDVKTVKDEDPDATEYSSSFGNTYSGSESELKQDNGDMEVDSPFIHSNADPTVLDDLSTLFKKKKVSARWRKFINPLMWRSQWLELRMKELLAQASVYDKELAAYKYEKELQSKIIEIDSSVSRSVPFASRCNWKRSMKRRRRRRNEDKVDISYMSNHVVFSYYENKRADTDCHSIDDDSGDLAEDNNKGNDDNDWLLSLKGSDSSYEHILLNIEAVQSRIIKLKSHLDNVICSNARDVSSGNLFLGDPPASCAQNASGSPRNNRDTMPTGLLGTPPHAVSEYEMEDMVMPESAASSYGDAADIDIIESTVGLLSAADVTLGQHHIRDLFKDSAEDVLIDNQAAEEEYQNFEKVNHATEILQVAVKSQSQTHSGDESIAPEVSMPEQSPAGEDDDMPKQALLRPCYTGKKRGRKPKKKRLGGWVAGSGPAKSKRLHDSGSSRKEKLHDSGPSRSKRLHDSGTSKSVKLHGSGSSKTERLQVWVPLRSERIKKRRLLASKKS